MEQKSEKKQTRLKGRILKTSGDYIDGLGPVICLQVGFREVPVEEDEKTDEDSI